PRARPGEGSPRAANGDRRDTQSNQQFADRRRPGVPLDTVERLAPVPGERRRSVPVRRRGPGERRAPERLARVRRIPEALALAPEPRDDDEALRARASHRAYLRPAQRPRLRAAGLPAARERAHGALGSDDP